MEYVLGRTRVDREELGKQDKLRSEVFGRCVDSKERKLKRTQSSGSFWKEGWLHVSQTEEGSASDALSQLCPDGQHFLGLKHKKLIQSRCLILFFIFF